MIILDIETSGLDPQKHSLLSLGAVDFDTGAEFYGECYADKTRLVDPYALAVNGFTEEQARDCTKYSDATLYLEFLSWVRGQSNFVADKNILLGGQQVGSFDVKFLEEIHSRYKNLSGKWLFGHRTVDLHSVAFAKFGESLSLDGILVKFGLAPEVKPHNALNGAKLERDAFRLLLNKAS